MSTSRTRTAPARPETPSGSMLGTVWLVAEREITTRLRSKAFLLSSALLLLLVLGSILWSGFQAQSGLGSAQAVSVAASAELAPRVPAGEGIEVQRTASDAASREAVASGEVDAAIVASPAEPGGITVLAATEAPSPLIQALTVTPTVELLEPADQSDAMLRYLVAIAFGVIFLLSSTIFGNAIAQSVVEEKQTRVVEILMSTISVRALLAGKVLGNTVLAFAQVAAIAVVAIVGLTVTGQDALLAGIGAPILWFVIFFVFGFVLLAAMFSAFASLVSRQEDLGAAIMPVTMLIMLPYFAVIFFNDDPQIMKIMSFIPFSAPVGMPVRMFLGEAQWWEPLLSLVILLATAVAVILLGARIYSNSLLHTGARLKLSEAVRG